MTLGFHKMLGSSCVAEKPLAAQGLSHVDLVNQITKMPTSFTGNVSSVSEKPCPVPHTASMFAAMTRGTFAKYRIYKMQKLFPDS
jgi:hypothetical protein